jgi:lactate 2-monooxygenase
VWESITVDSHTIQARSGHDQGQLAAVRIAFAQMAGFADYYRQIYALGLGGETPSIPVAVAELERLAVEAMDERAASYVCAGAGGEDTMDANRKAFGRWRIVPRMLRDVASRDLSTTLLGTAMPAPLLLAPIGVQKVVHPDGELATARAAASLGVPMIASTASAYTLEEIAEAGGEAPRWFQLYWPNDRRLAASLVGRAEAAGYSAIVLTVDTFVPGWKPRDLQQAWLPFLNGVGVANYFQDPVFREGLEKPPEEDVGAATGHFLGIQANPALAWDDLAWLREQATLPILVKGIQHAGDAREAAARGIDGIVVSNHGGRQVDGAIASLDALPPIAEAAGERLTILFDSGIRGGSDAIKALALGADAVCLGRPYVWGLALEGQQGVETVLKMILAELDLTMALCGYTEPGQLDRDALVKAP